MPIIISAPVSDCRSSCTVVILEGQLMGFCERHRCQKTAAWVKLCQTRPDYFNLWEAGVGPGQPQPENTIRRGSNSKPPEKLTAGGVGTELKLILRRFRIVPTESCKCNQRAQEMDSNGIPWCEEHLEEIVDWLKEESEHRHLPFVDGVAVVLIRWAIKNAKRKEKMLKSDDPIHRLSGSFEMAPSPEAFQ